MKSVASNSMAYRDLLDSIVPLARELSALQQMAKEFGVFTDERELLECPTCGLIEDVAFSGALMTYYRDQEEPTDSGRRFEELGENLFRCPVCKTQFGTFTASLP